MRFEITDELWAVLGPMVQRCRSPLGPAPELPDRLFFDAIFHWARTGCPWRDLPSEYGDWSAVYNRFRRWIHSGRLEKLFAAMIAQPECTGTLRLMIDSTIIRAHQHAAGAAKKRDTGRPRFGPISRRLLDEGHRRRHRRGHRDRGPHRRRPAKRRAAGPAGSG